MRVVSRIDLDGTLAALDAANGPNLSSYDRFVVAFSGGKDSVAALLALIEAGAPLDRIELWHHDVDGGAGPFMDWRCTTAYCAALAASFGLPLYLSHRDGGIAREMDRDGVPTAPVSFQVPGGDWQTAGGNGRPGTRLKFPQVSPDLSVRWCSAYVKIDVMDVALRNQVRFELGRTLIVTGERAAESPNRARYATFEPHRADNRNGARRPRYLDHWRPVHAWSERDVWAALERHNVVPHVAYLLGWGRLSCLSCIFGSPNQWATIRAVFPDHFERIAAREAVAGVTIQRKLSVRDLAARGTPYAAALANPELVSVAQSDSYPLQVRCAPGTWTLPAGAYGESAGPV